MSDKPEELKNAQKSQPPPAEPDPERDGIVSDENGLLEKTHTALASATRRIVETYDQELLELRDEIASARLEDLPPLVQQMERLSGIAARRAELPTGKVDVRSPYFGHMRLLESGRKRDVLIGNATYIDTERGVRIVDWRDAPVSKLYYRYAEGDDYEEEIAERILEGTVQVRRSVVIVDGILRRIIAPQGAFVKDKEKGWRRLDVRASKLAGGQGTAERPATLEEYSIRRGRLGVRIAGKEERHLPAIPALIDPRQFELIARPASGLVVIQGGAGSGKTTIGLHRIAYLNFQDPKRFSTDKLLVVVFNDALANYISRVLPGLGVEHVQVITYADWAQRQREKMLPGLPTEYSEDTPPTVTRLKKHPALLRLIDDRIERETKAVTEQLFQACAHASEEPRVRAAWTAFAGFALSLRVTAMRQWLIGQRTFEGDSAEPLSGAMKLTLERALDVAKVRAKDIVWDWAEVITDEQALRHAFATWAPGAMTDAEIATSVRYCSVQVQRILADVKDVNDLKESLDEDKNSANNAKKRRSLDKTVRTAKTVSSAEEREAVDEALGDLELPTATPKRSSGYDDDDDDNDSTQRHDDNPYRAIDGVDEQQTEPATLDREDDALLLRLYQRKRGPLRKDKKQVLLYEHIFVDEAQDLSPIELAVLLDCVTPARSVTLAGDTAQRLLLDNGFTDWQGVLKDLGLHSISIEPLKIGYRSTAEVLEFARAVLGPLADPDPPIATRSGAPVELHRFPTMGAAVGFLGEALRDLALTESRASVCVIARDPERADIYYEALKRAEVPRLTRVRSQDFGFKAGVEVTDIRQVKGLEFDYVVLADVTHNCYPPTDESRHLLHIGATRAAHQLWLIAGDEPSRLLPESMRD